ncbi:hypothetical protein LUZ60_006142 [Juncus effusus]|nr:hypothetical protein LUZ60_006142 [Juncus effusus]
MCRCGQGDPNLWTNRPSDSSSDKQSGICLNCQIIKSGHLLVSSKVNEKLAEKSTVIHKPVDFALEDENGNPSFLEKALCFIEDYGIKVEGILRQSADVEEVKRRVHDYEQGKDEFLPNEDAHVIGDCIKLVLREMPGYPVPAACCTTLVEVFRTEQCRILRMLLVVESHKTENRMSLQALAACMAPLLLRPLLVGDLEGDFNQSAAGENSVQLLQAAAAANHAQAIIILLLEEFDHIFDDDEDQYTSEGYTEDDGESHEEEEGSSDNEIHEDEEEEEEDDDVSHEEEQHEVDVDDDHIVHSSSSEGESKSKPMENVSKNNMQTNAIVTHSKAELTDQKEMSVPTSTSSSTSISLSQSDEISENKGISLGGNEKVEQQQVMESQTGKLSSTSMTHPSLSRAFKLSDRSDSAVPSVKLSDRSDVAVPSVNLSDRSDVMAPTVKRPIFGRTSARKNLSMESVETHNSDDDEHMIQKLESTKAELQTKLAMEKKENEVFQANLEKKKEVLHERRLALEKELDKLREQLTQEKRLRSLLESGLTQAQSSGSSLEIDSKVLADLEDVAVQEEELLNLKQKVLDLRGQYNNQLEQSYASLRDFCNKKLNKDHSSD